MSLVLVRMSAHVTPMLATAFENCPDILKVDWEMCCPALSIFIIIFIIAINQDYTPLSSEVTFKPANAPRLRVTVAIGDDGIVEGTESLFLLLAAPEGERSIVFGSNQSSIFIQDDDGKN